MFTARQMLRQAPRLGAQLRAPVMRNVVQRRLASTENSFVKERGAVKEHAAGSTGMLALNNWTKGQGLIERLVNGTVQTSGARSLSSMTSPFLPNPLRCFLAYDELDVPGYGLGHDSMAGRYRCKELDAPVCTVDRLRHFMRHGRELGNMG